MRRKAQPQRSHNYSHLPAGQAGNPRRSSLTRWGRGQSTLEYFIIFAVIAALTMPLLKNSLFSKAKLAGRKVFKVCVKGITKELAAEDFTLPFEISSLADNSRAVMVQLPSDMSCDEYTLKLYVWRLREEIIVHNLDPEDPDWTPGGWEETREIEELLFQDSFTFTQNEGALAHRQLRWTEANVECGEYLFVVKLLSDGKLLQTTSKRLTVTPSGG